jgi:hypothetical protein
MVTGEAGKTGEERVERPVAPGAQSVAHDVSLQSVSRRETSRLGGSVGWRGRKAELQDDFRTPESGYI